MARKGSRGARRSRRQSKAELTKLEQVTVFKKVRKRPYRWKGAIKNEPLEVIWYNWIDAEGSEGPECTVCGARLVDSPPLGVSWRDGEELIRNTAGGFASGGGWRSRGPVLYAMSIIKAERWQERHINCRLLFPTEIDLLDPAALESGFITGDLGEWLPEYGPKIPQPLARALLYPERPQLLGLSSPVIYLGNTRLLQLVDRLTASQRDALYSDFPDKMQDIEGIAF